jgi:SAM-dependent methyltransferase
VVDVAFTYCLFQHLPLEERKLYAKELRRVVRPGGYVLLQVPRAESSYYVERPTLHKFTKKELEELFPACYWRLKIEAGNLERYFLLRDPAEFDEEQREWFLIAQRR